MPLLVKQQRTEEWFRERSTRITASIFNDVLNGSPNTWSRLIDELEGNRSRFAGNDATEWGERYEDEAIRLFELEENLDVERTGFWIDDDYPDLFGGSPDGLIGSDTVVEVKCPYNPEVHLKTLRDQKVPGKYIAQVQGNLWITRRTSSWFLSYDPRQTPDKAIVKIPVLKNQNYIDGLRSRLLQFAECWKDFRDPAQYFKAQKPEIDILSDDIPALF